MLFARQHTTHGWYSVDPALPEDEVFAFAKRLWDYNDITWDDLRLIGPQRALVGTMKFATTRGICFFDPSDGTVIRRYCYQWQPEARAAIKAYNDPTAHPPGNWIKHKGVFKRRPVDDMNPLWSRG